MLAGNLSLTLPPDFLSSFNDSHFSRLWAKLDIDQAALSSINDKEQAALNFCQYPSYSSPYHVLPFRW